MLHNYLRTNVVQSNTPDVDDEFMMNRNSIHLRPLQHSRIRGSREAFFIREKFRDCFNSVQGSVEWQNRAIEKGQY